jgi:flavin-dependent dehydrogenase
MIDTAPPPEDVPQPDVADVYDVIVAGGGPAGATVAALVAEHGHSVLLLERATVPRFHVGESLIPETYHVLKRLGLVDRMNEECFPRKYSVQFVTDTGQESAPFYFDEHDPGPQSVTWQVERGPFDKLLLDRARQLGAVVRTDARLLDVLTEGDRTVGVRAKLGDGPAREIRARAVVDATGQSVFVASRLGLVRKDERLQKGTVWSYFKGAHRDPAERDAGATLIVQTEGNRSWFWYIPLRDDVVSVGCTGAMSDMFGPGFESAGATFERELARCPGMQWRLENATRCADYLTTKDFSYRVTQGAGDGWVLVGDALGFIDPVYSSGVFLALASGAFAADALHEALEANDVSAARLGGWQAEYLRGKERFHQLVYAFYTPGFRFGEFLREYPQHKGHLVDVLVGNVFFNAGVDAMFEVMGEVLPPSDRVPAG